MLTYPAESVDARTRGLWLPDGPVPVAEFCAARHPLFGGPFSWPLLVARASAVEHNIATLAAFCARHGFAFAPHGKTTVAPKLFQAQLDAGAWGITAATANQVLAYRSFGLSRILLANELVDVESLRWIATELERDSEFEFYCYMDSSQGVAIAADAYASAGGGRPIDVLIELGPQGGRTGLRDAAAAIELARLVDATAGLRLAGVSGYEGILDTVEGVRRYLTDVRELAVALAERRLLGGSVVVSAGGSRYIDVVADVLAGDWLPGRRLATVLRSGAYVTHDHGAYERDTPFRRIPDQGALIGALELWAQVTSVPERGLAIAGMGKREAPYDMDLPVALRVRRRDGTQEPIGGVTVSRLNDHHAYLDTTGLGAGRAPLEPGDLVCFGISHPCTAFDKWRVIPLVDDSDIVIDLIHTYI